jgi:Ca2+-binding EF-hand superfamily protein
MFSHYDVDNDGALGRAELSKESAAAAQDDMKIFADGCDLHDLLAYEDRDKDGLLSMTEFYEAFSKLYSKVSEVN